MAQHSMTHEVPHAPLYLPALLHSRLAALARARGISLDRLVREVLEPFVADEMARPSASVPPCHTTPAGEKNRAGESTYRERRLKGLCPRCGRMLETQRYTHCTHCRAWLERWRAAKHPRTVGERLLAKRLELGYSQPKFGALLGIPGSRLRRLEHGDWGARPSPALRKRVAKVLGCTVAELGILMRGQRG